MERSVKRWYAFCPNELHIPLFENEPKQSDYCNGCNRIAPLSGIAEGYVSQQEADKGRADLLPLSTPNAMPPPARL
jgi:hypothetical protein